MPGLDSSLIHRINYQQAIDRIANDINSDFIFAPHYSAIYKYANNELWEKLKTDLISGNYNPQLAINIEVPKKSGLTRPGSILNPIDRLLYQVIIDEMVVCIEKSIDREKVFSNEYDLSSTEGRMFTSASEKYTHRRLLESHRLWHQTLDNYFDPEAFRVNLNATIQALRNLTFALQNEKSEIIGFTEWYGKWQDKMKQDSVLKWLNSARVEIVHKCDLERKSIARVAIFNYEEIFKADIDLPIDIPEYKIALYLRKKGYISDENILLDCVLKVERRWVADGLVNYEILDALAYCYGFMYKMVEDAHLMTGSNIENCPLCDTLHQNLQINYSSLGIPNCMIISNSIRTKQISLKSLETKEIIEKKVSINDELVNKAAKRYKRKKDSNNLQFKSDDLVQFGKNLMEMAKNVLAKDGYHAPMVFLFDKNNKIILYKMIVPENKSDKFVMIQQVARDVKSTGAEGIIFLCESWVTSDIESYLKGIPTELHKAKKECLTAHIASKSKVNTILVLFFSRNKLGKIKFDEIEESKVEFSGMLAPIIKIWNS